MSIKNMESIYMDCNSTAFVLPGVKDRMIEAMNWPYNPSSQHRYGQMAHKVVADARVAIKQSVNAGDEYELVFTSGGTEANNLIMNNNHLHIISSVEHSSILKSAKNPIIIPVNKDGLLDIEFLEHVLLANQGKSSIVSVVYANNETGIIQEMDKIACIVHKYGSILHTDAVQAYGKIAIDIQKLDVDLITISAHKAGGSLGIGALIYKRNVKIIPMLLGGGQEKGYRSGTENIPAISGFGFFAININAVIQEISKISCLRNLMESKLRVIVKDMIICGYNAPRLPNTSLVISPNISGEMQLMHFDMHGVAVSIGSACSSGKVEHSHVLLAMGFSKSLARCALRVSLGRHNSSKEVDTVVSLWKILYDKALGVVV